MMNIIFAGQNAEKTAETLFPEAMNTRSWASDWLGNLLAKRGCVLSYYAFFKDEEKDRMGEEIKKEEYRLSGNGLFYRLFKRKIQTYND